MGKQIQYSPHALIDIEEAFQYYDQQKKGLGKRFVLDVQATAKRIFENPKAYAVRYDQVRCAGIWKFPFLVHFHFDEINQSIIILSVYHTLRKPRWT